MHKLEIKTLVLGELNTNSYLIWNTETLEGVVIDPADSGDVISEEIIRENITLTKIILTHGHFDHILGLLEVKLNFPQAPIYLHRDDLFLLETAQKRALHWLQRQIDPVPLPDIFIEDHQEIIIADVPFSVIHTPGHTPGSISLYSDTENLLISGDTLFKQSIGRTDFKYSDHQKILDSLNKISQIKTNPLVISGHGEKTYLDSEKGWLQNLR
jgi:hydroxyacylglutathione hydrolase